MIKSFFKSQAENFQRFIGTYDLIKIQRIEQEKEYNRLKQEMELLYPGNPALCGQKVYSQTDEDGIIEEIFSHIPNNKIFLEIGIQTGVECNSLYLLLKGWKGTWVEGSSKYCNTISKELNGSNFKNKLSVVNSFIDKDNIVSIFKEAGLFFGENEIDFFSLDIDGNDFYIAQELFKNSIFPKVICVEYNAKFHPPHKFKIEYNKAHVWDKTDYMGCSLQDYTDLFESFNYTLICCNIPGINAFFVRNEFAASFKKYTTNELYQPYRYYLSPVILGHTPSLKYLRDILKQK
jgi:hypothetical protein